MIRRAVPLAALVCLAACGDPLASPDAGVDAALALPDAGVAFDAAIAIDAAVVPALATIVRVLPWPGGGVQVVAELPAGEAEIPTAWVETSEGAQVVAVVEALPAAPGLTAIVIVPAVEAEAHAARLAAATALLEALPDGERVAVWVAGAQLVLVAELSLDRAHARAQIAAVAAGGGSAVPKMFQLRGQLTELESKYTSLGRTLVVVGETVGETVPGLQRPVQTLSFLPGEAAEAVVARLLARRGAIVRVGTCPGVTEDQLFALHLGETVTQLAGPEAMEHLGGHACDAAEAAADAFPFPDEIDLRFSEEERVIFDQRIAAKSEEPFRTSAAVGDGTPIGAEAHLRGSGTLNCARKSFSVELDGPRRRLAEGLATDRFVLISMCQDTRYFGQVFGDRILAGMGLFPPRMRYVRLRFDGVNQGVYLLLHQPERAFRDTSLAIESVVRRRYDIDQQPAEAKFPSDPVLAEAARVRFEAIGDLALAEPPETLEAALDARLELDSYLRMLALYSLLENGDFIDEAYFASSLEAGVERYRVMGWDTDDLFSLCHGGGGRGIVDDCGVTYCAEAELDYAIVRSPAIYRRYLEQLADVMAVLTPEVLAAVMEGVREDLWVAIVDDETAAALTEMVAQNPAAATVAGAREDIAGAMEVVLERIEERRVVLGESLAICPAAL